MAMDMEMDLSVGLVHQIRHRSPDSDAETPPRNPPTKRVHHTSGVSYKECMKNHAASIGGHALDGCCEFMPSPLFNPADPTSLKCGACGCHRNFHRRDPDDPAPLNHHPITAARKAHSPPTASQLLLSLSQSPSGPSDEVNLNSGACGGGGGGGMLVGYTGGQNGNFLGSGSGSGSSKKRFRTKFSQEQKEKMYEFSEKIGWKLRKGEERLIEEFVKEIGVERSVFKVWMHNNKHTSTTCTTTPKLLNDVKIQEHHVVSATTTAVNFEQQLLQQQQQQHNSSNGSKSSSSNNNNNNNVGNCGASVFDNHPHHHHHHHHHHHRQFNFGNGGGQEAAQAQ